MNLLKNCCWLLSLACLSLPLPISHAATGPAIPNDPAIFPPEDLGGNTVDIVGWTFEVKSPVVVRGLAWYDHGRDGLLQSHLVGLWKDVVNHPSRKFNPLPQDLAFLTALNIPSGTNATLDGPWRRVDFEASLALSPGVYELVGTVDGLFGDSVRWAPLMDIYGLTIDDRMEIGLPAFNSNAQGLQPADDILLAYGAEFGPMLFIEQVPEPSTALLAVLGAGSAMFVRARRSRRT